MAKLTIDIAPHAIVDNINVRSSPLLATDYYLNLALMYAEKGFYVFPVNPNKVPYKGFAWSKLATNNPDEIKRLWQIYPNGRPAFYCKKSGVLILDTDNKPEKGKYGFKMLTELTIKLGILPKTVLVYTQSNGTHMYFKLPKDRMFKRKIGNCIDIQTNHYCLCGGVYTDKSSYRFAKGYTFEDITEIPELPSAWIEYLSKPCKQKNVIKCRSKECSSTELIDGDFRKMYENCAFCKYCVDNADSLSENDWFKFAIILSRLTNGYELFDQFSRPYPNYDFQKTKEKFENAKKYSISCSSISIDFEGCQQCRK